MLAIDFGPEGVVVVAGRLDAAQAPTAQAFLDRVEGVVTLDCSRLEYISSAGLGVLLKTQKRLLASGRQAAARRRQPPPAGHLHLLGLRPDLRDRARALRPRSQLFPPPRVIVDNDTDQALVASATGAAIGRPSPSW